LAFADPDRERRLLPRCGLSEILADRLNEKLSDGSLGDPTCSSIGGRSLAVGPASMTTKKPDVADIRVKALLGFMMG
jgi:hypothetical protein